MRNLSKNHWLKIAFFATVLSGGFCFSAYALQQYIAGGAAFVVFGVSLVSWLNMLEKRYRKVQ